MPYHLSGRFFPFSVLSVDVKHFLQNPPQCHLLSEAFLNSLRLSGTVICSILSAYAKLFMFPEHPSYNVPLDSFTQLSTLPETGES